ncbi:MAG: pyruvate kinase [Granulosicoccus sp.]|jgi:pyruvate kinase
MTIKNLEKEISHIYEQMIYQDSIAHQIAEKVHPQHHLSAKNLYNYMLLRSFDLRKYHDALSDLGISAIRTPEGYVFNKLQNVIKLLRTSQGKTLGESIEIEAISYKQSKKILRRNANNLFNRANKSHFTEIMVTMPDEVTTDIELLKNLVSEGMEIARINLGRGNMTLWKGMLNNINRVKKEMKVPLKVYMDLAGPKIRTAKIEIISKKGKVKNFIKLRTGDHLILTKRKTKGKKVIYGDDNKLIQEAEVGVLLPQIIDDLKIGDPVFFDDGMIEAVVISKKNKEAKLVIKRAYKNKLTSGKGINLPNTELNLPSLTSQDIEMLPFACKNADIIGYSFVRKPEDVKKLYQELEKLNNETVGVIYKIETQEAFENLSLILFEAMKRPKIGVMIARGSLAIEIGFERISEVQNQILWVCEAAHIPVIWATQVLENLAKTGIPTRAEISDAAMSAKAECVMLNQGEFILDAVRNLKNILVKMEAHSFKKKNSLRVLNIAQRTLEKIDIQYTKTLV